MIKDAIRKTYDRYMLRNIRKNNIIDDTVIIREFTSITDSKIGYHSGINSRCEIHGLTMGNYSQIGPRTTVGMRDHIYKNFTIVDDFFSEEEKGFEISVPDFDGYLVKIGNDVWIGGGVIITARCEIGNGAVVAGGAVVTRSVPPYAIVGGNPAKIIGWRFDEDVQRKLEEIQWYNWTVEKVEENKKMLTDMVGFSMENYTFNYCKRKKEMTRIEHR